MGVNKFKCSHCYLNSADHFDVASQVGRVVKAPDLSSGLRLRDVGSIPTPGTHFPLINYK